MFPLFKDRFWREGNANELNGSVGIRISPRKSGAAKLRNLSVLDLQTLPREDGPPSELRARKEKLAFYEKECSQVGDKLFVAAEYVAKNREVLRQSGITHVVNCVGFLYPPYFEDELKYTTLYLQDKPGEDILCILYDVFDFIEEAMQDEADSHILVHCSQGVSRSAALAIAYLMWKQGRGYDDTFAEVKQRRGIANPNIGFICQLLQWWKRVQTPPEKCRIYKVSSQSSSAPRYLVPRVITPGSAAGLDSRGAFVIHMPKSLYVWVGCQCPDVFVTAAHKAAQQIQKYENAPPGLVQTVYQGQEPADLISLLGPTIHVREVAAYDKEYELWSRSLSSRSHTGSESARSGRKTPRDAVPGDVTSPNDRMRKQAKSSEIVVSPALTPMARQLSHRRRKSQDVIVSNIERGVSIDSAAAQLVLQEQNVPMTADTSIRRSFRVLTPRENGHESNRPQTRSVTRNSSGQLTKQEVISQPKD